MPLLPILPEIFLTISAFLLLLIGVYTRPRICGSLFGVTLLMLAACFALVLQTPDTQSIIFNGMFVSDAYTRLSKLLLLAGAIVVLLISGGWLQEEGGRPFEYLLLFLFSTLGMLLLISAQDLLSIYMALELSSLALYVLASFERDEAKSSEAGLKYFVLGALASGMMLYGISLLYGFTGSTDFAAIVEQLSAYGGEASGNAMPPPALIVGMILLMVGFCFKLSAAPFHMWTPDVYEGAPTPVTAYFAVVPKIGTMLLFTRLLLLPLADLTGYWQQVIVFAAVASMAVGAFGGLMQTNIKRLLAYSSIGHVGFMLMGVAAATPASVEAVLVYLAVYIFMSAGAFACILMARREGAYLENISDFAGLWRTHPLVALMMAAFMLSMAGIPPLAGFFGKFYVILAVIGAKLTPLAVIGLLFSVVSCYYYLRVVKVMLFDDPQQPFDRPHSLSLRIGLFASMFVTLAFAFFPSPLVSHAKAAAQALLF